MIGIGSKVAWSHEVATQHGARSVLKRTYVEAHNSGLTARPRFGEVVGTNEQGTIFGVRLEPTEDERAHGYGGPDVRELTSDELVEVE